MTHGMGIDEVNGDKPDLVTTILDDAHLGVVSGGASMETTMYVLGVWGLYGAEKGVVTRHR